MNYFQPSFKLVEKTRDGARVTKRYDKPATPGDRLLEHGSVGVEVKDRLRENRARLDPVVLLHTIRQAQSALVAVTSPEGQAAPNRESLEQFLSQLPDLWRLGEVRPTHAQRDARPRTWRTRKDPFEGAWSDVLLWLQQEPDATAKALLERVRPLYPGRFTDGQLRTLQRRVRQWRGVMAKELIYASADQPMPWALQQGRSLRLALTPEAQISVTFPDEATRPAKLIVVNHKLSIATIARLSQLRFLPDLPSDKLPAARAAACARCGSSPTSHRISCSSPRGPRLLRCGSSPISHRISSCRRSPPSAL